MPAPDRKGAPNRRRMSTWQEYTLFPYGVVRATIAVATDWTSKNAASACISADAYRSVRLRQWPHPGAPPRRPKS